MQDFSKLFEKYDVSPPATVEPISGKKLTPIYFWKCYSWLTVIYKTDVLNEYCADLQDLCSSKGWPNGINPPFYGYGICSSDEESIKWLEEAYTHIRNNKNEYC